MGLTFARMLPIDYHKSMKNQKVLADKRIEVDMSFSWPTTRGEKSEVGYHTTISNKI